MSILTGRIGRLVLAVSAATLVGAAAVGAAAVEAAGPAAAASPESASPTTASPTTAFRTTASTTATSTTATASTAASAAAGNYDWPEMHGSPQLTGYAANGGVTTGNVKSLGVRWSTNLYGAMLDSPVVAYVAAAHVRLAFIGTDNGNFYAVNEASGAIAWVDHFGGAFRSTPVVSNGAVWVSNQFSSKLYKIDAATGVIDCSAKARGMLDATPVTATPPGGKPAVFFGVSSTVESVNQATCATQWSYKVEASIWDSLSYGVDRSGTPLLLFGDANPQNTIFAVNARTGQPVWHYQTTKYGDSDIGAGITISPPGKNGFADGVAYAPAKDGYVYALDLAKGTLIWRHSLGSYQGVPNESLACAALDGNTLIVGNAVGMTSFNAHTGAARWAFKNPVISQISPAGPAEEVGSPAISGPAGHEVIAASDLGGVLRVLSLSNGAQQYAYQTGSWITSGPAVSGSDIVVGSTDGYLYDFAPHGGNHRPATVIKSPALGSSPGQAGHAITVSGSASDGSGVKAVIVSIRQGGDNGLWWHSAKKKWNTSPATLSATLSSPKSKTTDWHVSFPVPPSGSEYRVDTYAVSVTGTSAVPATDDEFFVRPASGQATVNLSRNDVGPNGSLTLSGSGFGAGKAVSVSLLGKTLAKTTSSSAGTVSNVRVTIPGGAGFGPTDLLASASGGKSGAAPLDVANSWSQQGYGPDHAANEPFDPILDYTIDPGQNILLDPAWHKALGSDLTAPAFADQTVYTGDATGTLHAVSERTAHGLWTWRTPTKQAITGAPAVSWANGLVYVGAADGTLYAVHTSGKLAWSRHVGSGKVFAPALLGDTLWVATNGTAVQALSASKGTVIWSATAAHPVTSAPSFDPAAGVVVVPTSKSLEGLSAASGKTLWSFGMSALATPVLAGGVAYVGSGDHHVYAVSESTGKVRWSATTGGPVPDAGALYYGSKGGVNALWIGSDDGNLYALNPANGAKEAAIVMGSGTMGVAVADGTVVAATSGGLVQGVRAYGKPIGVWTYDTRDGALSPPAVVDGTVYAAGHDGALWAFTPYGQTPM
jgi:outer membrane protein assembly factor BamB